MRQTYSYKTETMIRRHHEYARVAPAGQCGSIMTQSVEAPMGVVWSLVREFIRPQAYKRFVRSCVLRSGHGGVGSVREVRVVSGLPAGLSLERLDRLDDDEHVMSFAIIGGDHRLQNYRSTVTVHEEEEEEENGRKRTVVIESYVVDVPAGSSGEDTCAFANTIIRCNLMSLARTAEKVVSDHHDM